MEGSRFFQPTLPASGPCRPPRRCARTCRLLYTSGKLTKEQAFEQLDEIKVKLRDAICAPEKLQEILAH